MKTVNYDIIKTIISFKKSLLISLNINCSYLASWKPTPEPHKVLKKKSMFQRKYCPWRSYQLLAQDVMGHKLSEGLKKNLNLNKKYDFPKYLKSFQT